MAKDYKQLAKYIKDNLDIYKLLDYYGIWHQEAYFEHNISCPVMGEGHKNIEKESHPSCRCFPDTNSVNCFTCGFNGDTVSIVMQRDHLKFAPAVDWLIQQFDLRVRDLSRWQAQFQQKLKSQTRHQEFTSRTYLQIILWAQKQLAAWHKVLCPTRESLFYHLVTKFYAFEYSVDSFIELAQAQVPHLPDPAILYQQFISSCHEFMSKWKQMSYDDDLPLFLQSKISGYYRSYLLFPLQPEVADFTDEPWPVEEELPYSDDNAFSEAVLPQD